MRRARIGAIAECAVALALVLVAVAPSPVAQPVTEHGQIFVAQRGERLENFSHGLIPFYCGLDLSDDRDVGII